MKNHKDCSAREAELLSLIDELRTELAERDDEKACLKKSLELMKVRKDASGIAVQILPARPELYYWEDKQVRAKFNKNLKKIMFYVCKDVSELRYPVEIKDDVDMALQMLSTSRAYGSAVVVAYKVSNGRYAAGIVQGEANETPELVERLIRDYLI